MASISPGISMNNLVKSVQERYSVNVRNLPKGKIESVYRSITEGRLPMPPLVLSEDKTLLIDRKSPLSGRDYKVLFNASSTKRQLFGLARKMHLLGFKELKKNELVEQIKRKLQVTGICEPVLLQVKRKSGKVVSELPNNANFNIGNEPNNNFKLNNNIPKNNNFKLNNNIPKNNNFKLNNNVPKNISAPQSINVPSVSKTKTSPIKMSVSTLSPTAPSLGLGRSPKINFGPAPRLFSNSNGNSGGGGRRGGWWPFPWPPRPGPRPGPNPKPVPTPGTTPPNPKPVPTPGTTPPNPKPLTATTIMTIHNVQIFMVRFCLFF